MKNTLEYLITETNLKHNILKLNVSLDDLKRNNPGRTDLIHSMTETRDDLVEILGTLNAIALELTASMQRSSALEIQVQQLLNENRQLKQTNQN